MPLYVKYQVFALGRSHDGRAATLFDTLRRRVTDLGLSPTDDVELAVDPDVARIDTSRAPTASVFGRRSSAAAARKACAAGARTGSD